MITFIVPTLNRESLDTALSSIIEQTNPNWQAIIVGDKCYPKTSIDDERMTTLSVEGKYGASEVRNSVRDLICTEWVGFLDDDDVLCPEYVEHVAQLKDQCDFILFRMNNYGNILPKNNRIEFGNVGISFAMKTELFLKYGFEGHECGEDFRMVYTIKKSGHRIFFSNYIAYIVRPHLSV